MGDLNPSEAEGQRRWVAHETAGTCKHVIPAVRLRRPGQTDSLGKL
jgi:hypothetical protein